MINFAEFKKFFLFNLIGSLVISAIVAVIAVLIGKFDEVTWRVLYTLAMVVIHSIISLSFIWDDEKNYTFTKLRLFINVLFILIVVSFLTSILGIWKVLPGGTIANLYQTYFVVGFATLQWDMLSKALGKEDYMDWIIYGNYAFIILVVVMLQVIIYSDYTYIIGEMFYRILGAAGIIDGTLCILTIIFFKLYMHKHPEIAAPMAKANNVIQKK